MGANSPQEMHDLFEKYFNSKDAEGLLSLYEDDAVVMAAPGQQANGKEAIRQSLDGFLAMGGTITFLANADPMVSGDYALTHGKWKLEVPGMDAMEASTAEVVHRGADGQWRYVIDNPWGTSILDA